MGKSLIFLIALGFVFSFSCPLMSEENLKTCKEHPDLSGDCFKIRGRMSLYNGTPSIRIWPVGTNRLLGVVCGQNYSPEYECIPEDLEKALTWENAIFADFIICPFADDKPGVMRSICVESAENVSIRKWP